MVTTLYLLKAVSTYSEKDLLFRTLGFEGTPDNSACVFMTYLFPPFPRNHVQSHSGQVKYSRL